VKLKSNINTVFDQNRLKPSLFAAWIVFALLFAVYITNAWITNTHQVFTQLDTINKLVSKNTQQQASQLFLQLKQLNRRLLLAENPQAALAGYLLTAENSSFDHGFLVDQDGRILTSSFRHNNNLRLDLSKIIITPAIITKLQKTVEPHFVPTFSLGAGSSSQYVAICMSTQLADTSLLCLAISTENERLSWNNINDINDTAIRIIGAGNHLLYADPLPLHKRTLLGTKITSSAINQYANELQAETLNQGQHHHKLGIDGVNRMCSVHYLESLDLFIFISTPTTQVIATWLEEILPPFLFMLLLYLISFLYYRLVKRNVDEIERNHLATENTLHEKESTLNLLFSNIPGMIYRVRIPDYKVLFITDGCQELLGYSANSYLSGQRTPFDNIHEDDQDILIKHADSVTSSKKKYEHIFRIETPSGELKWLMDRGCAIREAKNRVYLEGILLDISEHMISQQQVEYLATRDPLTELANRYFFNDELVNYIDRHHDKTTMALLFIDLDRFKTINDSLGHQVGDRLLKIVAERLKECIDDKTLLARLGGDEFMIMMKDPESIEAVETLAHSINLMISKTYELDYYKLNTSCSIGISMYPQDSTESHILLRNADTAMYSAKAKGGNRYQFYTDEMNQKVNSRLTIENELRRAIKDKEFEVHYQPQVNAYTGELEGAEALVRWIHPTAGMISPVEFIPVAEETGLIRDIGDWVLEQACMTFKEWNQEAELNLSVAVNVSVRQLDDSFVMRVEEILNQTALGEHCLELEITESLLMDNVQENVRILENLNRLGVRFAMDDFGTGYSSLSYLRQFPIGKLKIDRSFVNDITDDPDDEAIIRAIIAMGQTLKLKVLAEGVENHQQLVLLQAMGCDSYQGFFFSKPLPAAEFYDKYIRHASDVVKKNNGT
jgi:diguanylate cyclase (GGDEF)-like protein/PAS domain S-box-containing protein